MGTRGSKVQKICSDFDVQIKIPDRANKENGTNGNGEEAQPVNGVSNDIIRITGRSDNCEAAKQALVNLVPINIEASFINLNPFFVPRLLFMMNHIFPVE